MYAPIEAAGLPPCPLTSLINNSNITTRSIIMAKANIDFMVSAVERAAAVATSILVVL